MNALSWYESDDANASHADSLSPIFVELGQGHLYERTCTTSQLVIERCTRCDLVRAASGANREVVHMYGHPEGVRYAIAEPACTPDWWVEDQKRKATAVERVLAEQARREKTRIVRKGIFDGVHEELELELEAPRWEHGRGQLGLGLGVPK